MSLGNNFFLNLLKTVSAAFFWMSFIHKYFIRISHCGNYSFKKKKKEIWLLAFIHTDEKKKIVGAT